MSKYIYLCFLINSLLFYIPIALNLSKLFETLEFKTNFDYSETYIPCFIFYFFFEVYALIHSLVMLSTSKIETFYRFQSPVILISFSIFFILFFIFNIYLKEIGKNTVYYKNLKRQQNIEGKIDLVNRYIEDFNRRIHYERISIENKETLKNTLKILEQIKNELEISLTAVDINIISQSFKDVEIQEDSVSDLQKELDKMKAYRSLSDISFELEDLMKKYDK